MPKSNSQQKGTPDARTATSKRGRTERRGRSGEEPAALLRVGTGQKALRAVGGRFFKLWESEGRIDRLEHTAGGSQNKGTEKLEKSRPIPAGGRRQGEGKGANSAPEKPPPPTRHTGPGSYLKTS